MTTTKSTPLPDRDKRIQTAQMAVIDRMNADLAAACSTLVAKGRIVDGIICYVSQGRHSATMDMGHAMGGDAAGPSPGFFARAAIVGCVGIGVKMLAAREGIVFRTVDVTIETDFDDAALMGLSPRSAAPYATRIRIDIDSDADPVTINNLVERALSVDPWYLALRDAQTVQHAVNIVGATPPLPAI